MSSVGTCGRHYKSGKLKMKSERFRGVKMHRRRICKKQYEASIMFGSEASPTFLTPHSSFLTFNLLNISNNFLFLGSYSEDIAFLNICIAVQGEEFLRMASTFAFLAFFVDDFCCGEAHAEGIWG